MTDHGFDASLELRVPELREARRFYETIVGLEALEESAGRVVLGSGERPVVALEEAPGAAERGRTAAGLFHLAIRFPTRESLSEALRRVSREEYGLTGASDHAVSEALYTNDPAGNGVELYVDRPRSAWAYDDDGEVVMVTERLDLDDLWRATDGRPGDRAPAETILGHVHLEVTDLEASVDFYRDELGMELQVRRPGAAFLSYDGYHHHVACNVWNHRRRPLDDQSLGLSDIQVHGRGSRTVRDPDGLQWRFA